jgi:two-component sensor histidine kinase
MPPPPPRMLSALCWKTISVKRLAQIVFDERAADVMLAVHELAANAVRHGAGSGRARLWAGHGMLTCRVEDAGRPGREDRAGRGTGSADGTDRGPGPDRTDPWSYLHSHGLWIVQPMSWWWCPARPERG